MVDAYAHLHRLGYAHSVEAWEQGELVGGLYGVSLGRVFFGESMYALRPDASKIALLTLAAKLTEWGFRIIDSQVATPQTLALGAEQWPRHRFLKVLAEDVAFPTRRGSWANEDPALEE
jgi:leucyl/phenylalanyl-tRNA--protein transferase